MAYVCKSPCIKNEVQLAKIVCMVALDEVDLLEINPFIDFVLQKITMTYGVGNDTHQEITTTSSFAKDDGQEFTPFSGFVKDIQHEQIGMNFGSSEQIRPMVEVSDYHLIFDLNGVLVATNEGQTKSCLVVLKPSLKEFLFACVEKFMVYIWSSIMKRNFLKHLDIIIEKTCVFLLTSRILDQILYFRNDHFFPKKT
jgi:hypothetical protein